MHKNNIYIQKRSFSKKGGSQKGIMVGCLV